MLGRNINFGLLLLFIVFCSCNFSKSEKITKEEDLGWFNNYRNIQINDNHIKFEGANITCSIDSSWKILPPNGVTYLFNIDNSDINSYIYIVQIKKNNEEPTVLSYLKKSFIDFKKSNTEDKKITTNLFYIKNIQNNSIVYGEVTLGEYTLKTCMVENGDYLYDFSMNLPTDNFDEIQDKIFSQFLNSCKTKELRCIPHLENYDILEIDIK